MRKLMLLFVLVAAGGLMAFFAASAPSATRVKVGDNYFVRASGVPTVTVSKGTRVRWVWTGRSLHNVKVERGPGALRLVLDDLGLLRQADAQARHLHDHLHRARRRRPEDAAGRQVAARTLQTEYAP